MNSNTMTNTLKPKNPNPNIILLTIPWEGGITLSSLCEECVGYSHSHPTWKFLS